MRVRTYLLAVAIAALFASPAKAATFTLTQERASFQKGGFADFVFVANPFWQRIVSVRIDYIGDFSLASENLAVLNGVLAVGVLSSNTTIDNGLWITSASDVGNDYGSVHTAVLGGGGLALLSEQLKLVNVFNFHLNASSAVDTFPRNHGSKPIDKLKIFGFEQFTVGTIAPSFAARITMTGVDFPVPLPAGLPLLASAIAVFGAVRLRQARVG